MSDEVISASAVQATPAGYQVPSAQSIRVKSVRAVVDGTGAGTAFLATLRLVSPDGRVVWESAQDTAIAAGGSADASWFPGVSAAAAAATSGSGCPVAEIRQAFGSTLHLTAIGGQTYQSLQDGITAHFSTTDATVFNNSSTTLFTGSPLFGIGVLKVGTYRYDWNMQSTNGTVGNKLTTYWSSSGTAFLSALQTGRTNVTMNDTWDANATNHNFWTEWQTFINPGDVPGVAVPWGQIAGGAAVDVTFQLIVTQVSPIPLTDL